MKKFSFITKGLVALTLLFGVGLLLLTCDKPFEPVEAKDYPFYIANLYPSRQLFIFHPTTNKLDSVSIPWYPYPGITVSADGKLIYISQATSATVIETDSFSIVTELVYPQEHPVAVSPDNQFITLAGNDILLLRTSDYSLAFSDTAVTGQGVFSADSRTFYYLTSQVTPDTGYFVHKVNLVNGLFTVTTQSLPGRGLVHFLPSVDETKWFLYSNVATWTSTFEVYDVNNDSIIFRDFLSPGAGSIAISPDGRLAFYTNPGNNAIVLPPPDYSFTIFDIYASSIDTIIKAPEYFSDTGWSGPPNLLSVSPDSKTLGILGGSLSNIAFYVFDIEKKDLIFRYVPDSQIHEFINLSVQSNK